MARAATARTRRDAGLKAEAETVLKDWGRMIRARSADFPARIALPEGLPFEVEVPNAEAHQAMKDPDEGKDVTRYEDFGDFLQEARGE